MLPRRLVARACRAATCHGVTARLKLQALHFSARILKYREQRCQQAGAMGSAFAQTGCHQSVVVGLDDLAIRAQEDVCDQA